MKKILNRKCVWFSVFLVLMIFAPNQSKVSAAIEEWSYVGVPGFGTQNASAYVSRLSFSSITGEPYIAKINATTNQIEIMKYSGEAWFAIPSTGLFNEPGVSLVSMAFQADTNVPYISFVNKCVSWEDVNNPGWCKNRINVMKFNGSSWEYVGERRFSEDLNSSFNFITFNPLTDEPYVVGTGKNNPGATVWKFDGNSWINIGNNINNGQVCESGTGECEDYYSAWNITFNNSTYEPYIALANQHYDRGGDNVNVPFYTINVFKYNGSSWSIVGSGNVDGYGSAYQSYPNININSATGEPYIAYRDGGYVSVRKFDGLNWVAVGSSDRVSSGSHALAPFLTFHPNTHEPYLSYTDGDNNNVAAVKKFSGGEWVDVGSAGFSTWGASATSITFNPITQEPYLVYSDGWNGGKTTVMKYVVSSVPTCATSGDIDCQNGITITDIQIATNLFLGIETDQAKKDRADFDGDGAISIDEIQKVVNAFLGIGA